MKITYNKSFAQTGQFNFSYFFNVLKNNCLNSDIEGVNKGENFCWTLDKKTGRFHNQLSYTNALLTNNQNFHNYNDKIPCIYDKNPVSSNYKMKIEDGVKHIISVGHFIFFENGNRHSVDHPTVIKEDGGWSWWLYGENKTHAIEQWAIQQQIDLTNMTDVDKVLFRITWLT